MHNSLRHRCWLNHHDVLQRNLPNKRHIGKQDPYCTVILDGEKRRTKAIKRGGQHPEWDEEIRFTLYEDEPSTAAGTATGGDVPPTPPKKDDKAPPSVRGGTSMSLMCHAEYLRDPEFIGDTKVDLTEVLTKGETDGSFASALTRFACVLTRIQSGLF